MKRWLWKFLYAEDGKNLKALKVVTVASWVLFFCLLELLRRYTVLGDTGTFIWSTLILLIIVIVAAFFFSKLILAFIDHLQKERAQRLRELATLGEIHDTLDEFHNLRALLNRAMDKLIQITAADSAELYLADEQSHELVYALHGGLLDDISKSERHVQLNKWVIDEGVLLNQQVITVEDLEKFQSKPISSLTDTGARSLAIVPMQSRSGTAGFITLFSLKAGHFKLGDADLLLKIGSQIAMAIEKARLYEKVQAVAIVEERERIAAELHDGLAQVLSYVITKSQATRQLLQKVTAANDHLVELEDVAQGVYTDTREAILGLRTAIGSNGSMVSTLREYAVRFGQMYDMETELIVNDDPIPSLSPQVELQAVRIVQEALSNVRKHARATRATIKVAAGEDEVTITVQDHGKGFDVNETGKGDWTKFGLRNMKERAESIHGSLLLESKPGHGTEVTLTIPLTFSKTLTEEGNKNESTDS